MGLEHYYGNTAASAAKTLTLNDLCEFARHLDIRYFEHARDWCACLLAFFGLLRVNEYMNAGLRQRHIQLTSYGVDITVVRSKTSNIPVVVFADLAQRPAVPSSRTPSLLRLLPRPRPTESTGRPAVPVAPPRPNNHSAHDGRGVHRARPRARHRGLPRARPQPLRWPLLPPRWCFCPPAGRRPRSCHSKARQVDIGGLPCLPRHSLLPGTASHRHSCPPSSCAVGDGFRFLLFHLDPHLAWPSLYGSLPSSFIRINEEGDVGGLSKSQSSSVCGRAKHLRR